jgi:hypothetical protein
VQGEWADAVDECRRALRLDSKLADAHRWFGYALAATGRYREARESWEIWEDTADGGTTPAARGAIAEARAAATTLERQLEALRG